MLSACPWCNSCRIVSLAAQSNAKVYTMSGVYSLEVPRWRCLDCQHWGNAIWVEGRRQERWLHQLPSTVEHVPSSDEIYFSVDLLSWLDSCFGSAHTTFEGFADAYVERFKLEGPNLQNLLRDMLQAYLLWAVLTWAEEASVQPLFRTPLRTCSSSINIHCNRKNDQIELLLKRFRPLLDNWYNQEWIANHAAWCSAECAASVCLDGSGKLWRRACTVIEAVDYVKQVPIPRYCGAYARRNRCSQHTSSERNFNEQGAHRMPSRKCTSVKETTDKKRRHSMGIMAATFMHCRTLCFPMELIVSESCTLAYKYVHLLAQLLPALRVVLYDDACHLRDFISSRDYALLRQVRFCIDRFHMRNHVQLRCHSLLSADAEPLMRSTCTVTLPQGSEPLLLQALWQDSTTKVRIPVDGQDPITKGSRLVQYSTVHFGSKAQLLHAIQRKPLPLTVAFRDPYGPNIHSATIRNERSRTCLVQCLAPSGKLKVRWRIAHAGQNLTIPFKAMIHEVDHVLLATKDNLQQAMEENPAGQEPINLVFSRPVNSSASEQNWRLLNRHKHTLRSCHPEAFHFLMRRLFHLHNKRLFRKRARLQETLSDSSDSGDTAQRAAKMRRRH